MSSNNDGLNLMAIETLLNEFYSSATPNSRKHSIELELLEYQNSTNLWQLSIKSLYNYNNEFFWFFNISTVELTIARKWSQLNDNEHLLIRNTLWETFSNLSMNYELPKIQRDKIAQLLSLIGKREFPDDDPHYMNNIIELLKNKFIFGIALLRATVDELISTKNDITTEKQKHLSYCISMYMPTIFPILSKFLLLCVCRLWKKELRIIPNSLNEPYLNNSLPDDARINTATIELLICIQQMFQWTALENSGNIITEEFINNLFELAKWNENHMDVTVQAIATISELFYRQKALPMPMIISNGVMDLIGQISLKKSNELYQDKLTELLRLFTTQQWTKLLKDPKFPAMDFLTYLNQFTFSCYGALTFTERLAIWLPIIKSFSSSGFGRFTEKIIGLVSCTLRKMQFQYDQDMQLEVLDNEDLDDDMETELQHFLTQCIDCIAIVTEILPTHIYGIVVSELNKWEGPFEVYMSLIKTLTTNDKKTLAILLNDQTKCHYLHCMLRDLSSLCRIIARISTIIPDKESLTTLTLNLIYSIKLSSSTIKLFNSTDLQQNRPVINDYIETFAQVLLTLKQLLLITSVRDDQNEMSALVDVVAQILLPTNHSNSEPKIVTLAASQLLLGISSNARPKYLIENRFVMQLVQSNLSHLDKLVAINIQKMICNSFLLPWTGIATQDQNYERRSYLMQEYINFLALDLTRIDHTQNFGQDVKVITVTTTTLSTLKEILDYYQEHNSPVKHMIIQAYRPIIEKTLAIYNSFGCHNSEIAECVLNFFLSIIRTLQIQLGSAAVRDILVIFLESSKQEQITIQRLKSIDKLLKMLLLVVEQPGASTNSLIPDILCLALDHVAPLLFNEEENKNNSSELNEVAFSLYALFDGILQHRWQYFYKSQVSRGFSPGASDSLYSLAPDNMPQNLTQFTAILTAYGRAIICSNDPHITRTVLTSLQILEERWKLYQKEYFKQNLLKSFLNAIIRSLLSPEGILHYDLLLNVLFRMGQANQSDLHQTFIDLGWNVDNSMKLIENICLATDLPTFSHHMTQLIQDTKCSQFSQ